MLGDPGNHRVRRRLDFYPLGPPVLGGDIPLAQNEYRDLSKGVPGVFPGHTYYDDDLGKHVWYSGDNDDLVGVPGVGGYSDGMRGSHSTWGGLSVMKPAEPSLEPWDREQWKRMNVGALSNGPYPYYGVEPRQGSRRRKREESGYVDDPDVPGTKRTLAVLQVRQLDRAARAAVAEWRRAYNEGDNDAVWAAKYRAELLEQQSDTTNENRFRYGFGFVRDRESGLPPVPGKPVKPKKPMKRVEGNLQ